MLQSASFNLLKTCSCRSNRIWFWIKDPTDDHTSSFNWSRDNVYGAMVLLGAGGATVLVISMAMIAYLVGKHTVSVCKCEV